MRHLLAFTLPALLAVLAVAPAPAGPCGGGHCQANCKPEPCTDCNCPCPCEHRLALALLGPCHVQKLISQLGCDSDCCERIHAVKKLGHRLHADFCTDPCVLSALVDVALFDPCWQVRREAVWAIWGQRAATDEGLRAVYIASKMDPHVQVRLTAAEALDLLTLCHKPCYKALYQSTDELMKELSALGYKATAKNAHELYAKGMHNWIVKGAPSMPGGSLPGPVPGAVSPERRR